MEHHEDQEEENNSQGELDLHNRDDDPEEEEKNTSKTTTYPSKTKIFSRKKNVTFKCPKKEGNSKKFSDLPFSEWRDTPKC